MEELSGIFDLVEGGRDRLEDSLLLLFDVRVDFSDQPVQPGLPVLELDREHGDSLGEAKAHRLEAFDFGAHAFCVARRSVEFAGDPAKVVELVVEGLLLFEPTNALFGDATQLEAQRGDLLALLAHGAVRVFEFFGLFRELCFGGGDLVDERLVVALGLDLQAEDRCCLGLNVGEPLELSGDSLLGFFEALEPMGRGLWLVFWFPASRGPTRSGVEPLGVTLLGPRAWGLTTRGEAALGEDGA